MTLYCDTSSLIKLYISEPGSDDVRALVGTASVVTSSAIAHPEVRATLARLRRERLLTPAAFAQVKRQFEADWPSVASIAVDEQQIREAGELADRHGLRALDGIHLAAFASIIARAGDDEVEFSSFDERLVKAAKKLG